MENKLADFTDEELLLELIHRNKMMNSAKRTEHVSPHYEVLVSIGNNDTARIVLPIESFCELCDIVYESEEQCTN